MNTQLIETGVVNALRGAKTWARRYAWISAIILGIMALLLLGVGVMGASIPGAAESGLGAAGVVPMIVAVIVMGALTIPPILFLMGFANSADAALASGQPTDFAASLTKLKSFFKFYVILTIVVIVIYALVFISMFAFMGSMAGATP